MKKLFLSFATVILLVGFQACKQKAAEETSTEVTDSTVAPAAAEVTTDSSASKEDTGRLPVVPETPPKDKDK